MTFIRRKPPIEDKLYWRPTYIGRWIPSEDDLYWNPPTEDDQHLKTREDNHNQQQNYVHQPRVLCQISIHPPNLQDYLFYIFFLLIIFPLPLVTCWTNYLRSCVFIFSTILQRSSALCVLGGKSFIYFRFLFEFINLDLTQLCPVL